MTLVVARLDGPRIAIAGDTRISVPGGSLPVTEGIIKSCLFPEKNLCVSFANSPDTAVRDLSRFALECRGPTPFNTVVLFFEQSSKETGNDYLLCFSHPPCIVKIANGRRQRPLTNTVWIGDAAAYNAFREHEAKAREKYERGRAINGVLFADEFPLSPASDLYSIMRHIVSDRTIESVGGFVYVIGSRPDGFRFSVYSDMLF